MSDIEYREFTDPNSEYGQSIHTAVDHKEKTVKFFSWSHDFNSPEVAGEIVYRKASDCKKIPKCRRYLKDYKHYSTGE